MNEPLWLHAIDLHEKHAFHDAWTHYQALDSSFQTYPLYWFCLSLLAAQTQHPDEAKACLIALFKSFQARPQILLPLSQVMTYQLLDYFFGVYPESLADVFAPEILGAFLKALSAHNALSQDKRTQLWHFALEHGLLSSEDLNTELNRQASDDSQPRYSVWPAGWHLLAKTYSQSRHTQRAKLIWHDLLCDVPDFYPAYVALGHLALESGAWSGAQAAYQRALELYPNQPDLQYQLGRMSLSSLDLTQAKEHFRQALALAPEKKLWQVQNELAYLPLVWTSDQAIQTIEHLFEKAESLSQSVVLSQCLPEIARTGLEPMFDVNYFGTAEYPLRQAFADIFILPTVPQWPQPESESFVLGVLVTPGHEGLFLFGNTGLLKVLSGAGVKITVFCWPASQDLLRPWTKSIGVSLVVVSADINTAIQQIQKHALSLLYYWESGTDSLNYFLPFFQLAAVQFTSWGSVSSTGNPRMQAFLSSDFLDPVGHEIFYREELARLPVLPIIYDAEMLISSGLSRERLGLPPEVVLLGSPHNPLKYSMDYLLALRCILEQAPEVLLVMVESRHPGWSQVFKDRLRSILGEQFQQVIILKRLPGVDFLALCQQMDLILDPFPFGAGKLTFECLGQGIPMLTLPSQFLRGRIVFAAYAQMGYDRLVATGIEDYIQKALGLIRDPLALQAHREVLNLLSPKLLHHDALLPALLSVLGQLGKR